MEEVREACNETELWITSSSKTVEVLREELAYSFISLVADIGGVLGLFIGFNFIMVWDGMARCVKEIVSQKILKCLYYEKKKCFQL